MTQNRRQCINYSFKLCECGCGEKIPSLRTDGKPARFKHNHHIFGPRNANWKGGITFGLKGYIRIKARNHHFVDSQGYIYEHRLVWEKANKASLLPWADVHHVNKVKHDNRPENLVAMMKRTHSKLHYFDTVTTH